MVSQCETAAKNGIMEEKKYLLCNKWLLTFGKTDTYSTGKRVQLED